jgi:hypothetical protein
MLLNGMRGRSRPDRALPLDLRLRAIADNVPTSNIDQLWVFPPLPNREVACEFLVLVCYDGGPDRRRILTAHVDAQFRDPESDQLEWVQRLREHGAAPQRWVAGIPDRLLQRLADAGVPEVIDVGGRPRVWEEAITRFAKDNGNGDGAELPGEGLGVDTRAQRIITFSTIIETAGSGYNAHTESGG